MSTLGTWYGGVVMGVLLYFKGSGYRKIRGVGSLYTDRKGYRTVVIDACLLFNGPVVFSATYFRFLLVTLN